MDTQLREVHVPEDMHVSPSSYKILRELGGGGFGVVYEAWDIRLCRRVALKRLKDGHAIQSPESLLLEGRLAASVSHPAFVRIYAVDGDADSQSIVMELVEGVTLRQFMRDAPQPEAVVLDIVRQVAEAMDHAHASQVVHGDLKVSNLMREETGRIRILDFGLARRSDPMDTRSMPEDPGLGTIAYMAPERLQGQPPSALADMYALGVVMYELLAGRLPFSDLNGLAMAAAHLQSSPMQWPLPATVSAAARELLLRMTARDPGRRIAAMREVVDVIAAMRGEPAPALMRPRRHRPSLRYWLATAGVVACLAGGWWWRQQALVQQVQTSEVAEVRAGMDALQHFSQRDSLARATTHFEHIIKHNPQHAAATAGLSLVYSLRYNSARHDESWLARADATAQEALVLDDHLALAQAAMGWVREMQGKMDEALRLDDRALELDPGDRFALSGKINVLIKLQRLADADAVLDQALKVYPNDRVFTDLLGTIRFKQGNVVAAEQAFRRSIELDPASTVSYANLNAALLYQNRGDEALRVLQQGLQVSPDSLLYANLGAALFERGDMAGAAKAFEQALSTDKGNPNFYLDWANLADALRWLPGREAESHQAYLHAAELLKPQLQRSPDSSILQSRMGLYAAKGGDAVVARQAIAAALASPRAGADTHFRIGVALEVLGERERALAEIAASRKLGYPANLIDSEPDLLSLRRDRRYHIGEKGGK